jgi:hypothetical protein
VSSITFTESLQERYLLLNACFATLFDLYKSLAVSADLKIHLAAFAHGIIEATSNAKPALLKSSHFTACIKSVGINVSQVALATLLHIDFNFSQVDLLSTKSAIINYLRSKSSLIDCFQSLILKKDSHIINLLYELYVNKIFLQVLHIIFGRHTIFQL